VTASVPAPCKLFFSQSYFSLTQLHMLLLQITILLQTHLDQVFVKGNIEDEVITRFGEHDWIDLYLLATEHAASVTFLSK